MKKIIVALCMVCGLSGICLLGCMNKINDLNNECESLKFKNNQYVDEINYSHELLNKVYSNNEKFVKSYNKSLKKNGHGNPKGVLYTSADQMYVFD